MPCSKGNTTLSEHEIKMFVELLETGPLEEVDFIKLTKYPLFKIRSQLRELVDLHYIDKKENLYFLKR